ncbi:PilC/PilY family type IV pilus protein [Pseudoalteromonas neustonica]|uniref:PilC/PilY family type IV pilus protein n=1 Tax=Pseudoalteromonas neustonica TaxID=1840331 RepID=A0ABU9TZ10_9GAMM
MKLKLLFIKTMLATVTFFSVQSYAEDIELYVNHDVEITENPRVLLVFDTSGSMAFSTSTGRSCGYNRGYILCSDSRLGVARDAMTQLVNDNEDIDFGLMRFNGSSGGYVLAKMGSNRTTLINQINRLPADGATPLSETLWEAYLYISGKQVEYGRNTRNRDYSAESGSYYISPFKPAAGKPPRCDNSVSIIMMTDGDPSNDSGKNTDIRNLYKSHFKTYPQTVSNNYLPALAKSIHGIDNGEADENVVIDLYPSTPKVHDLGRVYTVGFGSGMSASGKALLEKTAELGGGQYKHADTAEQLSDAFKKFITNIRAVNDTFTSPAVASNNVDQTRSRDSIYYAMFYPEKGARWRGNLKKLKVSGSKILDSSDKEALNAEGLIKKDARTFWLPSNVPADGNSVQSGGVNLMLTTLATGGRKLLTDAGSAGLIAFTKDKVSNAYGNDNKAATAFGVSTSELQKTIDWARGIDVDNEDGDSSSTDQRDDIFGDPLHSKPVTIDYGNDDVRILIGTNAGFLHMFQDKASEAGDTISESWAFIPSSLYKIIDPIRKNQPSVKKYGIDGPITVFFNDADRDGVVNGSDKVWAFFGMRRGGTNYYALDITNPDSPKLMWGGPIQGGTGSFTELAQSWSAPIVSYIKGHKGKPVLIFGAGYDINKDNVSLSNDSKGRGIYIIDAETGALIWELSPSTGFKGKHSIAADVTTLDSDYDGYIDRVYATDTAGSIWRIDMPSDSPTDSKNPWTHFELAKLGGTSSGDRRFFYKPMVARTMFSKVTNTTINGSTIVTRLDTPFDAVLVGSGNRSKPTGTLTQDQLYMIRDTNTVTQSFKDTDVPELITTAKLMNMNSDPFGNALNDIDAFTKKEIELSKFSGWYYDLPGAGEKSLAAATVIGGVAYFTSFTPASATETVNQCSLSGGKGSLYAFHLHYGTKVYEQLSFVTSNDVPDTPQLYFGEIENCPDVDLDGFCDEKQSCTDSDSDGTCDDGTPPDGDPSCKDFDLDGFCDYGGEIKETVSQFLLIGPGIKVSENSGDKDNPFVPEKVSGPGITIDENGKIKLVSDAVPIGFGFETQQTYIYKREVNDNEK